MAKPIGRRIRDFVNYRLPQRIAVKALPSQLTRPIASFTFDDFPKSALAVGGALLERHGAVGTYYAAGSLCGTADHYDRDDIAALLAAGHELGDHSYAHWHVPYQRAAALLADVDRNATFLREMAGDAIPTAFAYPYGDTSLRTKRLFAGRFASCRGTAQGLNDGMLDLGQLRVVSLEMAQAGRLDLDGTIARAVARRSWIIFYTHDVSDAPSRYGSTPALLERAIVACRDAGIAILPMRNALARACFRHDD